MIQKILSEVLKNIDVYDVLFDIANHRRLKDLKLNINYYNLERHIEGLLLKDN